jgi:hypothetical protein
MGHRPTGKEMAQVLVEQAIFSSDNNDRARGYQIVARSPGITHDVARELVRWAPSHQSILSQQLDAECTMAFPVDAQRIAIGRTIHGLPEYSGRGGRQTTTRFLVTSAEHLAGFEGNAWCLWLAARAQGYLQLGYDTGMRLSPLPLVAKWSVARAPLPRMHDREAIEAAARLLQDGRRVAIVGAWDEEAALRGVLDLLDAPRRARLSFATGLQPAVERPFDLQVLPDVDRDVCVDLSADRVALVRS